MLIFLFPLKKLVGAHDKVLTCTNNLSFRAEMRKDNVYMYPCKPQFWVRGGKCLNYMDMFISYHGAK